jgi:hypothetical protein
LAYNKIKNGTFDTKKSNNYSREEKALDKYFSTLIRPTADYLQRGNSFADTYVPFNLAPTIKSQLKLNKKYKK